MSMMPAQPFNYHLFKTEDDLGVLVVNGSRIYELERSVYDALSQAYGSGDPDLEAELLARFGLTAEPFIRDEPLLNPPVRSLSLAVAQKCNLGCTYCYAQQGEFGSAPKLMPLDVALSSVEFLLREARDGNRFNISFLGGEPLINRAVVRSVTEFAANLAQQKHAHVGFSITTNGTLLSEEDGDFFERYGFAVTVSLDGIGATHDRLRPFRNGAKSYERILERVTPLLMKQRQMQVSARVTVTPKNLQLVETLDEFIRLGFFSVGFSPVLRSPNGREEMGVAELDEMLEQMILCGKQFERAVSEKRRYPFSNMVNALKEIHQGTHRPYPCGAGAGYFGVSAEGDLSACHRFVGEEEGLLGNLLTGINRSKQQDWLTQRNVHNQEPCRSCWARYLCGGGCHHEVIRRGRPACDYIRGWLHYCLQAYLRLLKTSPEYFSV